MLRILIVYMMLAFPACSTEEVELYEDRVGHCYRADKIFDVHPSNPNDINNGRSDVEICLRLDGQRRVRLIDADVVRTVFVEKAPIHVRSRAFVCENYFLISDGSDSENVLGHSFENTIYRISDGQNMTRFSSEDLPVRDCSIFKF